MIDNNYMIIKCGLCDERGYIHHEKDSSYYSGISCKCGWAMEQSRIKMEERFGNPPDINKLLDYGKMRAEEKGKQIL